MLLKKRVDMDQQNEKLSANIPLSNFRADVMRSRSMINRSKTELPSDGIYLPHRYLLLKDETDVTALDDVELSTELTEMWRAYEIKVVDKHEEHLYTDNQKRWLERSREYSSEAKRRGIFKSTRDSYLEWKAEKKGQGTETILHFAHERISDILEEKDYVDAASTLSFFLYMSDKKRLWLAYGELGFEHRLEDLYDVIRLFAEQDIKDQEYLGLTIRKKPLWRLFTILTEEYKGRLVGDLYDFLHGLISDIEWHAEVSDALNIYKVILECFISPIGDMELKGTFHGYDEDIDYIVDRIPHLGIECGMRFFGLATRMIGQVDGETIRKYEESIEYLIEKAGKNRRHDFRPEGLLAKLLDYRERSTQSDYTNNEEKVDLITSSLQNPVFLSHLYEGRLPAYSWSAGDGEPMRRALTTEPYRAGYNAERRLIKRAVRDISKRYDRK